MAYKKDQGHYARMFSFWALALLLGYGCLGELQVFLRSMMGTEPWTDPLPLVGEIDLAKLIAVVVLAAGVIAIHRFLNRPKVADLLIDTELELRKVVWPSAHETWVGSVAVIVTVLVMLVYLFVADLALTYITPSLMGTSLGGGAG